MTFRYATDSEMGTVEAPSLQAAYEGLRGKIADAMIDDGATLWVESPSGERITMGEDQP